jgi:predicted transglutaminase-like cysteine proteinase
MRRTIIILCLVIVAVAGGYQAAYATFFGMPRMLDLQTEHLRLEALASPTMDRTIFCTNSPADCSTHATEFPGKMATRRWANLINVNFEVNRPIRPDATFFGMPRTLDLQTENPRLEELASPTPDRTIFCMNNSADCSRQGMEFRGKMAARRWANLLNVNFEVNRPIRPDATFLGMPRTLNSQLQRLRFEEPALPPMAHTIFCTKYPRDCPAHKVVFRGGGINMTAERWEQLTNVNFEVNHAIRPQENLGGLATEQWLVAPLAGNCHDYAVTKQHELLAMGWPSHALLLAEVVTTWGEHHLVLVIRTRDGDVIADNLSHDIRPVSKTAYVWVRAQTPSNPVLWATVARAAA